MYATCMADYMLKLTLKNALLVSELGFPVLWFLLKWISLTCSFVMDVFTALWIICLAVQYCNSMDYFSLLCLLSQCGPKALARTHRPLRPPDRHVFSEPPPACHPSGSPCLKLLLSGELPDPCCATLLPTLLHPDYCSVQWIYPLWCLDYCPMCCTMPHYCLPCCVQITAWCAWFTHCFAQITAL